MLAIKPCAAPRGQFTTCHFCQDFLLLPIFYTKPHAHNTSAIFLASSCMRMHIVKYIQYRQKQSSGFRDPQDCESFRLKTGFRSARGPFMTGFTVYRFNTSEFLVLKCNKSDKIRAVTFVSMTSVYNIKQWIEKLDTLQTNKKTVRIWSGRRALRELLKYLLKGPRRTDARYRTSSTGQCCNATYRGHSLYPSLRE